MPIDPYSPCPGGTGKKIKFCCHDLVAELDKIQRMLEGDQPAGCLEFIESLEEKSPDRACLLSIKAMLEAQLGQDEKAEATLATFMQKYPDNPVALAEKATLVAGEDPLAAIGPLQDALEKCGQEIAPQIYDAIGVVAQTLIAAQVLFAGRGHLMLQLGISGTGDQRPCSCWCGSTLRPRFRCWPSRTCPCCRRPTTRCGSRASPKPSNRRCAAPGG